MKSVIATALVVALAAGCSSSDDDSDPTPLNDSNGGPAVDLVPDTDGVPVANTPDETPMDTGADADEDVEQDTDSMGDPDIGADADAGEDVEQDTDSTGDTDADADIDADADSEVDPDAEVSMDTDGESEVDTDADEDSEGDVDMDTDADAAVTDDQALDVTFNEIIAALGVYEADALVERIVEFGDAATSTALGSREAPGSDVLLPRPFNPTTVSTTAVEYDCALGGSFVSEEGTGGVQGGGSGNTLDADVFRFEACRLPGEDGETIIDGGLTVTVDYRYGSRADLTLSQQVWNDLSIVEATDRGVEIDGTITFRYDNDTVVQNRSRTVVLSRFVETSNGPPEERRDDVLFVFDDHASASAPIFYPALTVSGTVTGAITGSVGVAVETVEPLSRVIVYESQIPEGGDPRHRFDGELLLRSDDGNFLTITGRKTATVEPFVDTRYVGADGTVRERENVPFVELEVPWPPRLE